LTADAPHGGLAIQEPVPALSGTQIFQISTSAVPIAPAPQVASPQLPAASPVPVFFDDSAASSELHAVLCSAGLVPASCRHKLTLALIGMGIGSEAALAAALSRDPAFLEQVRLAPISEPLSCNTMPPGGVYVDASSNRVRGLLRMLDIPGGCIKAY
jgi:hypothetical protein